MAQARPPDPYLGREIAGGKYRILQKIGSGGMGTVYKAMQPNIDRMVAIKILHPKLVNRKDLVSRFSREAKALGHLSHPNTVKVFDDGVLEDNSLFIVMEYLEGRNLNQIVRTGGPMPVERALPILMQVCGALNEAHQRGIVHRDLKPENIFLSTQGGIKDFPKVLDFGLAKVTEQEMRPGSIILTQEGMVFGTPEFMSPEQAQGKILDARSDIYSLAVILYEVLTGKLPFDAKTPMEYIQHHVMTPPIPLHERVPTAGFPPALSEVLNRALAKNPDDRYQTAAEFAQALEPFAQGKNPISAPLPYPVPSSSAPVVIPSSNPSSALTPAPSPAASNTKLLVLVATACLLVGAGLAVLAMKFL
ncbi:MAG: serine/threonine-protein kinase [Myxococcales bacterium]|nr:serine/threonine protein kinase [Polyangiaceae bacterium]MDW8248899.1 serine/threonine-protein kinase [Myxococcales bacterium]